MGDRANIGKGGGSDAGGLGAVAIGKALVTVRFTSITVAGTGIVPPGCCGATFRGSRHLKRTLRASSGLFTGFFATKGQKQK